MSSYPVLEERGLAPAKRRMFARRRDPAELPEQSPGTVLVFQVGGRYEPFQEGRHLSGDEEAVVDAVAVSVVDVRDRRVDVDLMISSANPANDFLVRTCFHCRVTQPETVVASRLTSVAAVLRDYLKRDAQLAELGTAHRIDDLNEVRRKVNARITAYTTVHPPRVGGMSVSLTSIDVQTPGELRTHGKRLRDEEWQQVFDRLRDGGEVERVERLATLLGRGPEVAEALAVTRGERSAAVAADRGFATRSEQQANLLEVARMLERSGHLQHMIVDPTRFVDQLTTVLGGAVTGPAELTGDEQKARPGLPAADGEDDDEPTFTPDEDDLA